MAWMLASGALSGPASAPSSPRAKIPSVEIPPPSALIDRVRALPAAVPLLTRLGDAAGVYLVGGAVRDLLLEDLPYDLDLVVEGDAGTLARRLGPAVVHDRFGTSTVTLNGFAYDIARARAERYARPGALPDVRPATLAEDLRRRDFTVNAMAIELGGARAGELFSVEHALEDLAARRLRVLHDRSFIDDPTRLLRLARYQVRLGFAVERQTRELGLAAGRSGAMQTVSRPRIGAELRLLAREPDPIAGLQALRELELDRAIHDGFGLKDAPLARRALALLPGDGRRDLLALALSARGVPAAALGELLGSLAFEAGDRNTILASALRGETVASGLERAGQPSEIFDAVGGAGPELIALAGALGPAEKARQWLEQLRHVRLEISGEDLLAAGVPEGPAVGRGLRAALAAKLDGLTSGRESELQYATQAATSSG
jgi:tRNA nucleotidyltransferase (CCA-adding enzyme)